MKVKIIVKDLDNEEEPREINDDLYWFEEQGIQELGPYDNQLSGYVCETYCGKKYLVQFIQDN